MVVENNTDEPERHGKARTSGVSAFPMGPRGTVWFTVCEPTPGGFTPATSSLTTDAQGISD